MRKNIKHLLILIILVILFLILKFCNSKVKIIDDITILSMWEDIGAKNEYEISEQKMVEIDIYTTMSKKVYKKIAPGSRGSFTIKFKRPQNSNYKIFINEKTVKPQNLVFMLENKKYKTLEDMEKVINETFMDKDKITIYWEWEYYIDEINDIQDTKDSKSVQRYIFQINASVEELERKGI